MNTILYIGDSYVTSLDQLHQILPKSLSPEMPIYDEILTLYLDGILEKWLEEGNEKSIKIAKKVAQIGKKQSNSKIMEQLYALFPDRKIDIPDNYIFKFLSLKKVVCKVNSNEIEISKSGNFEVGSKFKDNVDFGFIFSIDEIENESFGMQLIDNGKEIDTFNIELKGLPKAKGERIINCHVGFSDGKEHILTLNSNERQLFVTQAKISTSKKLNDLGVRLRNKLEEETIAINGVNFSMILVEGGTFTMGATPEQTGDASQNEYPAHQVTLSDFYIGEKEVTQELWNAVMGIDEESNPSVFKGAKRPVESVSWHDCQEFIRKLNEITNRKFRLPTEAEWEYAARGGNESENNKYAGDNSIGDVAWYLNNSEYCTHEVGLRHPNELKLYDMSGNVLEWCNDWYEDYSSDSQMNPTGASFGLRRVYRGGCWFDKEGDCRVSYRGSGAPDHLNRYLGLRLAL